MAENEKSSGEEAPDVDTVERLLVAAGLDVPDVEVQRLARLYPGLRRSVDRFHDVDVGDEVPAAVFRAGEVGA